MEKILGKIYIIKSNQTDNIYIGSTTSSLSQRLSKHKSSYKRYIAGKRGFVSSFDIIKFEDAIIELLEDFECQTKEQLTRREGELIKENNICVNKRVEGRTRKEYNKEHYQDNKEQIREQKKQYYQDNKEKIKEYQKQYYEKKNNSSII